MLCWQDALVAYIKAEGRFMTTSSLEVLRKRFEVEKALGDRLRASSRTERPALYSGLYAELFKQVPEHDRLAADRDPAARAGALEAQMRLLRPWLEPRPELFLEIGPGSGWLSYEMCRHAGRVVGADISEQLAMEAERPCNFEFARFDGISLPLESATVDLAFSYQVLEHQHPDDVPQALAEVRRVLKPGARYVLATPHRFSGPHDVSKHFSDYPLGLHLKEWTTAELVKALANAGFAGWRAWRFGKPLASKCLNRLNLFVEAMCGFLPRKAQRRLCRRLFQGIVIAAEA